MISKTLMCSTCSDGYRIIQKFLCVFVLRSYLYIIPVILTLLYLAGCAKAPVSGIFVSIPSANEIDMVHLVESSRGKLVGDVVITIIEHGGVVKTSTYGIRGHIYSHNVSFHIAGSKSTTVAMLFGTRAGFVGNLDGTTLTINHANVSSVLNEESALQYTKALSKLRATGEHIALEYKASKAIGTVYSNVSVINTILNRYIVWGKIRISHVKNVRAWYSHSITYYNNCLKYITPLAQAGVPTWRWQECPLRISINGYARDQQFNEIKNLNAMNTNEISDIYNKISTAKRQFSAATSLLRLSCRYQGNQRKACKAEAVKMQKNGFSSLLNATLFSEFKNMVPKITTAVNTDSSIATHGEHKLVYIANKVEMIYKNN